VKKPDADLSLENEKLDQYLEASEPEPPVVVMQYRKRGVPYWVLFPLIVFIPLASIWAYHRVVVEPYRVQAEKSRRALERWIETPQPAPLLPGEPRTSPLAANSQREAPAPAGPGPAGSAPTSATQAPAPVDALAAANSAAPQSATTTTAAAAPGAPPPTPLAGGPNGSGDRVLPDPGPAVSGSANPAPAQPQDNSPVAAALVQPPAAGASAPAGDGKPRELRLRSVLPNPFALDEIPAAPPTEPERPKPADLAAARPDPRVGAAGAAASVPDNRPGPAPAGGDQAALSPEKGRPATKDRTVVSPAVDPLPTKEESLREIEEEAARKQAEIMARDENREKEQHARRYEERVKFRDELREILRIEGKFAGPEIDKLAKRYGYDTDAQKFARAARIWEVSRATTLAKVRLIRSLELPESVILNFLSDDLHIRRGSRNGPRDENEVRVRAAQMLLGFELSEADSAVPAPAVSPRRSLARPGTPAPPADGASPRRQ
jgi:hypothetical protein